MLVNIQVTSSLPIRPEFFGNSLRTKAGMELETPLSVRMFSGFLDSLTAVCQTAQCESREDHIAWNYTTVKISDLVKCRNVIFAATFKVERC